MTAGAECESLGAMEMREIEVSHRFADLPGVRLHYVDKGRGPLVVLLHGFPETWWSWRYQIDPLVRAGYRVVVPDLRGYGESEQRGPYDLDTLAHDVRALIEHLGEKRAAVVGHDWGGAVAWHLAATIPAVVERLCVLNCPHPAMLRRAFLEGRWRQLRRSWYMFFFLLPWLPERILTEHGAARVRAMYLGGAVDRSHFGDAEIAPFLTAIQRPGAASAMLAYYRVSLAAGLRPGAGKQSARPITLPSLLLWAKDDVALGYDDLVPGTERYAPALRIETLERCGHFVQAERPEWVNERVLAFLRESASATQAHPG